MSSIKEIAKKIPNNVRSQILITEEDIIHKAIPVNGNKEMQILNKIWHEFIEPNKELTNCPVCLNNILTSFKQMKESLIELELEYQKLNAL
ncbi:hypothetical protein ETU08_00090 [Apibacter muscae]|uniref:hypothetical protein n=1 Tax=Apibacter muscae TaxID=2509004 RepID=UPI0011AC38F2|nr:hypothetical protein [Apibacter muscae]TWP31893.1 hypothetical protein ETU08_00090 [Apibacter muscae]